MEPENNDTALKKDFLATYHSILFSRTENNATDVERRRLAVKYLAARKFESAETSSILLNQGLQQYEKLLESTNFFKTFSCPDNEERIKWKSSLKNEDQVLSLIKPLPCQKDRFDKVCGRRDPLESDIENVMALFSNDSDEALSKAAPAQPCRKIAQSCDRFRQNQPSTSCFNRFQSNRDTRKDRNGLEKMVEDNIEEESDQGEKSNMFRTAKTELNVQQQQKMNKKTLGGKASVNSKFVCPMKREREQEKHTDNPASGSAPVDDRLKGIDEKLIELVRNEIMDNGAVISWNDVAGLEHAKKIIKEIVVLPMLRPDIFTGLRQPPKGILLFGPPGTGKTLIGKCIASQSKSTFFSISASSLTSKWVGESEKLVRTLFAVARVHQPSVIFIDEIDSLLTQRSETEHESSRRIKTEFLVQLDGATTGDTDRILVIGATNRPQELDEAARRRFVKRLYIPLPEFEARKQIVENLLATENHKLTKHDINKIASLSEHYSGADMTNLCKEASMGPIRSISFEQLENIRKEDVRCVTADDFNQALSFVRPSVSQSDLGIYMEWDRTYGSGTAQLSS